MKYISRLLEKHRRKKVLVKTEQPLEDCKRLVQYILENKPHSSYSPREGMRVKLELHSTSMYDLIHWLSLTTHAMGDRGPIHDIPFYEGWTYFELFKVNRKGESMDVEVFLPTLLNELEEFFRLAENTTKLHREYCHTRTRIGIQDIAEVLRVIVRLTY